MRVLLVSEIVFPCTFFFRLSREKGGLRGLFTVLCRCQNCHTSPPVFYGRKEKLGGNLHTSPSSIFSFRLFFLSLFQLLRRNRNLALSLSNSFILPQKLTNFLKVFLMGVLVRYVYEPVSCERIEVERGCVACVGVLLFFSFSFSRFILFSISLSLFAIKEKQPNAASLFPFVHIAPGHWRTNSCLFDWLACRVFCDPGARLVKPFFFFFFSFFPTPSYYFFKLQKYMILPGNRKSGLGRKEGRWIS